MSHSPDSPDSPSAAANFLHREHAIEVTSDHQPPPTPPFPDSDDSIITSLFDAEVHHMPEKDYLRRCLDRSIDVTARLDAVNWILKVGAQTRCFKCMNECFILFLGNAGSRILQFLSDHGVPLRQLSRSFPISLFISRNTIFFFQNVTLFRHKVRHGYCLLFYFLVLIIF